MNLQTIFSTKKRKDILVNVIYKINQISVNKIASGTGLSKGLVSKYLDYLTNEKILKRVGNKFSVQDNIKTRTLRILLNLDTLDENPFRKNKFVKSAGVYGSFVKGTNNEDSDIDMWVLTDKSSEEELAVLTGVLKKSFGNVRPIYLTKDKLSILKKEDTVFYYSLIFGSITIYGEGIEEV